MGKKQNNRRTAVAAQNRSRGSRKTAVAADEGRTARSAGVAQPACPHGRRRQLHTALRPVLKSAMKSPGPNRQGHIARATLRATSVEPRQPQTALKATGIDRHLKPRPALNADLGAPWALTFDELPEHLLQLNLMLNSCVIGGQREIADLGGWLNKTPHDVTVISFIKEVADQ